MKELTGKVAVVTGAASGIGQAMAERFAEDGMKVVLADVQADALEAAKREMLARGYDVAVIETDVSQAEDVRRLADFAIQKFGAVNVLCNNAGVGIGGRLWEHTLADWEWLLDVNLWGVIHGVRTFVPIMLLQGDECHIVNTASAAGLDARPWLGAYSATKYAVVAISEALRQELAQRTAKIGVSVLCPGVVNTRIGESERNRPSNLMNAAGQALPFGAEAFDKAFRAALAQGLAPRRVAEAVVAAILDGQFYIITHEDTESRVRARFGRIVSDAARAAFLTAPS